MRDPEQPLEELTVFDWVAAAGVCVGTLFCFSFPFAIAPHFAKVFAGFSDAQLPDITQLALEGWFPMMLGLNSGSILFYALSQKHTLGRRRLLIAAAFVVAIAASAFCMFAMYAPVFAIAGKIGE